MKRANGEGSVFKLKDGTWRAACPGGAPSFRGKTRTDAIRKRDDYLRKHVRLLSLPRKARDSFGSIIAAWLESKRHALRPRTLESYEVTAERYILPILGDVPVGKLTPDDILTAMGALVSARTRNYIRTVCHMALEYAVEREIVPRNVARKVEAVKVAKVEREMPSRQQWDALLAAISAEAMGTHALLLVIAFCGLREGEACGLRWVDYDGEYLRILRAADRRGELVPLKNSAGRRVVPVPERVKAALERWRTEQTALRTEYPERWRGAKTTDLIFTNRHGTMWSQRNVLRAVHRVTLRAGIGRRSAHELRHLAISHLVAEGVDIKTVQIIAGHSSIRVTLDTYGHLMPGQLEKAAAAMNRRS